MDENKSLPLHVTGILIYRIQRQVEFLFLNDTFSHKRHWTAPKGTVIRQEDEVKCALRNTIEITGLSVKDLRIEEGFRAEITYLSGTRPKRVVYYLAQVSDHARVYTTGEGLNIAWLSINNAMEKALYKSMQDVIKKASIFIENHKPPKNTESLQRSRIDKHQITGDRLDHKMKNLNLALPLDSQRQAMSEQRLKLVRKQQRQNQNQSEKNSGIVNGNGNNGGNGPNNGFASPLHSPVMQFENPLYKTRLCERFETEGYCPYGPKCTFAHGTVELRERPANAEEKIDTSPTAKDGPDNPLYKTRLCERFMKESFCQYGPKCNFAHGEHELRDRPNNPATSNPRGGDNGSERKSPEPHRPINNQQYSSQHQSEQQHHGRYQHPHHQARLNGSNNIEPERRTIPVSPGGFRSEIQNGILGRIPIIANSDSHSTVHNSAHVEESKPETLEEDIKVEILPEEIREEVEHEIKEKHNESKEHEEHREVKDSKDLSVTPSTVSGKPISSSKRRSGKDIISVDEKPWMQVVELSNVELEQLGKISWEKYLNTRNAKLLSRAALLFKYFYDKDYVEEDSVLEWYDQAKDTSDVKKRCAVFVEWLKNAEEED
ncbi:6289_t:CDS:2 [Funneliformis caledonium]|uniref:6289_t:CDS:1 n=1 Tax=Funneliformis caledonium TaxID=1117310 RepID=A0A9N9BX23_9GLOM|nr:6289_t:CDS:2 [Funneliformis caledonium]